MRRFQNLSDEEIIFSLGENAGIDMMGEAIIRLMLNRPYVPRRDDEAKLGVLDDLWRTA